MIGLQIEINIFAPQNYLKHKSAQHPKNYLKHKSAQHSNEGNVESRGGLFAVFCRYLMLVLAVVARALRHVILATC